MDLKIPIIFDLKKWAGGADDIYNVLINLKLLEIIHT